MRLFIDNFRC